MCTSSLFLLPVVRFLSIFRFALVLCMFALVANPVEAQPVDAYRHCRPIVDLVRQYDCIMQRAIYIGDLTRLRGLVKESLVDINARDGGYLREAARVYTQNPKGFDVMTILLDAGINMNGQRAMDAFSEVFEVFYKRPAERANINTMLTRMVDEVDFPVLHNGAPLGFYFARKCNDRNIDSRDAGIRLFERLLPRIDINEATTDGKNTVLHMLGWYPTGDACLGLVDVIIQSRPNLEALNRTRLRPMDNLSLFMKRGSCEKTGVCLCRKAPVKTSQMPDELLRDRMRALFLAAGSPAANLRKYNFQCMYGYR